MSIYINKKKWRHVKIGGQLVTKIYKNGEIIFNNENSLNNPITGQAILQIIGNIYRYIEIPNSQWYKIQVAASAGYNAGAGAGGGAGALIDYNIYLTKGLRVIAWGSSSAATGAPAYIRGGNGNNGAGIGAGAGASFVLGGGGSGGGNGDSGAGGGGAAGNGGSANGWDGGTGGAGAGLIIYQGQDYYAWKISESNELYFTELLMPAIGDKCYKIERTGTGITVTETEYTVDNYNNLLNTINITDGQETINDLEYSETGTIPAYSVQDNWLYLFLCGGGGGGAGDNGSWRGGGGGGGAGSNGGAYVYGGGTGGFSNLPNIQHGGNGSRYSAGAVGAGNVINLTDIDNPTVLSNRTGTNGSHEGYINIFKLE